MIPGDPSTLHSWERLAARPAASRYPDEWP